MITEATGTLESNASAITEEMTDNEATPLSPWQDDHAINTFFLVCTILMLFIGTIGNVLVIGKFLTFWPPKRNAVWNLPGLLHFPGNMLILRTAENTGKYRGIHNFNSRTLIRSCSRCAYMFIKSDTKTH